jgi:hypothetical protein
MIEGSNEKKQKIVAKNQFQTLAKRVEQRLQEYKDDSSNNQEEEEDEDEEEGLPLFDLLDEIERSKEGEWFVDT